MWHMWDLSSGLGWWMGGAWMLLFWGAIIALIVWVVKKVTNRDDSTKKQSPLDIARERYAKGEISKDEFEQLKKDIS